MTNTDHTTPTVQHTPGPWFYNRNEGGLYEHNVNVEEGEICQVFDPAGNDEGVKAANARLIAAAPTMLVELEHTEWRYRMAAEDLRRAGKAKLAAEFIEFSKEAQAVIAKAKGGAA
jgi:hypothetical protein